MKFGEQEAQNFYNVLSPELRSIIREVYNELRTAENLVGFKRQPPAQRLIYFVLGIWSGISTDRKQGPTAHSESICVSKAYLQGLQTRQSALFRLLDEDDDLGMIIRAHIHLEHELREFILAAAPQPAEVKPSEYDYAGTLRLAMTLGLNPAVEAGLTAVGTLRNKFAHRLEMKLTQREADIIYGGGGGAAGGKAGTGVAGAAGAQGIVVIKYTQASSGITITSATTDGADTSSASVAVNVAATSATTDGADTSSASVSVSVAATSATTDGADTSSASVTVGSTTMTSATTDGADTSSGSLSVKIAGTSATTNGADISSATLAVNVAATSTTTDGADISLGSMAVNVGMSSATTDGADLSNASVSVSVTAVSAYLNGADTSAASVNVLISINSSRTNGADLSFASVNSGTASVTRGNYIRGGIWN